MSNKLKPPIILLGNVRSGTTMMQNIFGLHPEICTWFEPRTIWNYAAPGRKYDRLDENDASKKVIRYIRRRFLAYQESNGGKRIMEKTPNNVVRIPYVHKIFPEAKFLYIIRNPLSQLSSSELKWQKVIDWQDRKWAWYRIKQTPKTQLLYYAGKFVKEWYAKKIEKKKHAHLFGVRYPGIDEDIKKLTTEEIIAKQWVYCSRIAEEDMKDINPMNLMRIRYEAYVSSPIQISTEIFQFFNLDISNDITNEIEKRIDPSRQNKWKRLNTDVLDKCLPILKDEMDSRGYVIPNA